jgi:hypothetical protein
VRKQLLKLVVISDLLLAGTVRPRSQEAATFLLHESHIIPNDENTVAYFKIASQCLPVDTIRG